MNRLPQGLGSGNVGEGKCHVTQRMGWKLMLQVCKYRSLVSKMGIITYNGWKVLRKYFTLQKPTTAVATVVGAGYFAANTAILCHISRAPSFLLQSEPVL